MIFNSKTMGDETPKIGLPTELVNNKNFFTLTGAAGCVFLICWSVNYVSFGNGIHYKVFRMIGLIISQLFSFMIMFRSDQKKAIDFFFALINGFLIFVNASGMNAMTSSYLFEPKPDQKKDTTTVFFHLQDFRVDPVIQAGIFPLPRMINWWPDEELIVKTEKLNQENIRLEADNSKMKFFLTDTFKRFSEADATLKIDSLEIVINNLNNKINEQTFLLKTCENNSSIRKNKCEVERDSLKAVLNKIRSGIRITSEKSIVTLLRSVVDIQKDKKREIKVNSSERSLMIQDFYKKMPWDDFSKSFDIWYKRRFSELDPNGIDEVLRK